MCTAVCAIEGLRLTDSSPAPTYRFKHPHTGSSSDVNGTLFISNYRLFFIDDTATMCLCRCVCARMHAPSRTLSAFAAALTL